MQCFRIATAFFLLLSPIAKSQILDLSSTDADIRIRNSPGYVYVDCANADFAPPLVACAPLLISEKLDSVSREIMGTHLSNEPDSDFMVLRSNVAPIAIPKVSYETQTSWAFHNRRYIKVKQGVPVLATGLTADLIAVVENADKVKTFETLKSSITHEVAVNIVLTLLYSPSRGVEAIGFPGGQHEGGLFYCVKKPCLFAARP